MVVLIVFVGHVAGCVLLGIGFHYVSLIGIILYDELYVK